MTAQAVKELWWDGEDLHIITVEEHLTLRKAWFSALKTQYEPNSTMVCEDVTLTYDRIEPVKETT